MARYRVQSKWTHIPTILITYWTRSINIAGLLYVYTQSHERKSVKLVSWVVDIAYMVTNFAKCSYHITFSCSLTFLKSVIEEKEGEEENLKKKKFFSQVSSSSAERNEEL